MWSLRRLILSQCTAAILLVACADTFPLNGQSGQVNIAIFGATLAELGDQTTIAIDMGPPTGSNAQEIRKRRIASRRSTASCDE